VRRDAYDAKDTPTHVRTRYIPAVIPVWRGGGLNKHGIGRVSGRRGRENKKKKVGSPGFARLTHPSWVGKTGDTTPAVKPTSTKSSRRRTGPRRRNTWRLNIRATVIQPRPPRA
jgi:hypothetical protein